MVTNRLFAIAVSAVLMMGAMGASAMAALLK